MKIKAGKFTKEIFFTIKCPNCGCAYESEGFVENIFQRRLQGVDAGEVLMCTYCETRFYVPYHKGYTYREARR